MDMNLGKLQDTVTDREPGVLQSWGLKESDMTEQQQQSHKRDGEAGARAGLQE